MTALALSVSALGRQVRKIDLAWKLIAGLALILAIAVPAQGVRSAVFVLDALAGIAPLLLIAVALAAAIEATGADTLVAEVFKGREAYAIPLATLFGALSPFCSCGVIPLIAALLSIGVPLAPVMAFWLSSPLMDPSMFVVTAGVLGVDFAIAKTIAAVGVGLTGGIVTLALAGSAALRQPLRAGIGDGGCAGSKARMPSAVAWRFWREPARLAKFRQKAGNSALYLAKWLILAFALESLMLAWLPAELIGTLLGGGNGFAIPLSVLVGIPAYLNGYAALGLVKGLLENGMAPGAGMAFLIAGGVTSIPAMMAVFALARWPVFLLYLGLSVAGALAAGYAFQFFHGM